MLTPQNGPKQYRITVCPPWLSESMRAGFSCTTEFSKAERKILRRRKKIKPSEWVEKHRIITHGPMEGSRMSLNITPHIAGQLDAAFLPFVKVITVCAAAQTAKSTMVDSAMGYVMDRQPGPALSVYPDKETATENCEERIKKMINNAPRLRALKTGNHDDITKTKIKLLPMIYYLGWAGSAISLSNKSIRYLDLQEVDKYKDAPNKKEAGTIELAEIRVRAYPHNHKIFITSSPTDEKGPVWVALTIDSDVIFDYYVRCPLCRKEQVMLFSRIKWAHGEDGHSLSRQKIANDKLAWYECVGCGEKWDDDTLGLEQFAYLRKHRPARIGYHQPSWISYFVSLSEVAADFLKTKDPRKTKIEQKKALKNFFNKHMAEPWQEYDQERQEDQILALCDDRPAGVVPGHDQTACLLFGVDTQDNVFYFTILAVGYGLSGDVWLVREGFVLDLEALVKVLWEDQYLDAAGNTYPLQFGLIDSAGHRTSEVYDFCRVRPGLILPSRGERTMAQPFTYSNVEFYPGTKKPFPGSLQRCRVNTTHFKDLLALRLSIAPADPGAIHLHADTTEDFAAQLCAEVRDDNGVWQQIGSRANHYWDCMALGLVAAEIKGIRYWPDPNQEQQQPVQQIRKKTNKRVRW